jgi:hypothetical protein
LQRPAKQPPSVPLPAIVVVFNTHKKEEGIYDELARAEKHKAKQTTTKNKAGKWTCIIETSSSLEIESRSRSQLSTT